MPEEPVVLTPEKEEEVIYSSAGPRRVSRPPQKKEEAVAKGKEPEKAEPFPEAPETGLGEDAYNEALKAKGIDPDQAPEEVKKHIQETRAVFLEKTQELAELKKKMAETSGTKPVTAQDILTSPEFLEVRRELENNLKRDLSPREAAPDLESMTESERINYLVDKKLQEQLKPMEQEYLSFKKQVATNLLNQELAKGEEAIAKEFGEDELKTHRDSVRKLQYEFLRNRNALMADEAYWLLNRGAILKREREKAYREGYEKARGGTQRKMEAARPGGMTPSTPATTPRDYSGWDGLERAFEDAQKTHGVRYEDVAGMD